MYGIKYKSPVTGVRALHSTEREAVRTGKLQAKWLGETRRLFDSYKTQYARTNIPEQQKEATLEKAVRPLFLAFIKYIQASKIHGDAVGKAIESGARKSTELSQMIANNGNNNNAAASSGMFSRFSDVVSTLMFGTNSTNIRVNQITMKELRDLNAIVQDNAEIAAQFGLIHNGANRGPDIDMARARATISADRNAGEFGLGMPGMAAAAAAMEAIPEEGGSSSSAAAAAPSSSAGLMGALSGLLGSSSAAAAPARPSLAAQQQQQESQPMNNLEGGRRRRGRKSRKTTRKSRKATRKSRKSTRKTTRKSRKSRK